MKSKVNVIIEENIEEKARLTVNTGDIVLIEDVHENKKYLTRVSTPNISTYVFYAIGETLLYEIPSNKSIKVEDTVKMVTGHPIKILGICDIDITIKDLKKYY